MNIRLNLTDSMFGSPETCLVTAGVFEIAAFRYASGVAALRIRNDRGEIIVLPYQGQQIWRASFDDRDLTMKSMFAEPVPTRKYLENYGAFYLHCGLSAIGAPGPDDTHELHGELPNAPFRHAWLEISDERVALCGSYEHAVAFATHYRATTRAALTAGSALIDIGIGVDNLRRVPMALMYLGHANFRPVDDGELDYSAVCRPDTVRVRQTIPRHIVPPPEYADLIGRLACEPSAHHRMHPGTLYDPEVVFDIDFEAAAGGLAYCRQIRPGGGMDYIEFNPAVFSHSIRWLSRTPDQDALGMALPSTTGGEGRNAELRRTRYVPLDGGANWSAAIRLGYLRDDEWLAR